MAMARSSSSISLIPKTTNGFSIVMLVGSLKNWAKVPLVNFLTLLTKDSAPSIPSRTASKSSINGILSRQVAGSLSGVMSLAA